MKFSGFPDMMAPLWVVVPTYWGNAAEGIYDHPTPLGGESTLPLLLDSLVRQDYSYEFTVLILLSTTSPALEGKAVLCLRKLLAPYATKLNLLLADATAARHLSQTLNAHHLDLGVASMRGYAAVRNMQLLVPMTLGAQVIAAVDDDEVLPADYLSQAMKWIGRQQDGMRITGIGGPYLDASGSPFMAEAAEVCNILTDKSIFMNATLRQAMGNSLSLRAERNNLLPLEGDSREMTDVLKVTPMAFGGNMVFHRELFTQVGFDPAITRGEDIDYVINARIAGQVFHFDSYLKITHLPPRYFEAPEYAKMRLDVTRFVYEREKIRHFGLPAQEFMPYPGVLLGEDFDRAALDALHDCATPEMISQFGSPVDVLQEAHAHARRAVLEYRAFANQWREAEAALDRHEVRESLLIMLTM